MNKTVRIILAILLFIIAGVTGFVDFAFIGAMTPVMQVGTTPLQWGGILLCTIALTGAFIFFMVIAYKLLTNKL